MVLFMMFARLLLLAFESLTRLCVDCIRVKFAIEFMKLFTGRLQGSHSSAYYGP